MTDASPLRAPLGADAPTDRERIKHAWGQLEQVYIDRGPSSEWIVCAAELWRCIDAALTARAATEGGANAT